MRPSLVALAFGCVFVACAQTKAPPPNVKEVPIPVRTTIPANEADTSFLHGGLTASQAVQIALAKQPTLENARQAVIAAEGRTKQVRSKLLPQLGVGGSYDSYRFIGNQENRLKLNVLNGYGASATISQLVFDANHSSDLVRQSRALESVAAQDLAKAKDDLALQVLVAYYLVGEAHQLVAVNERNVANRESQLLLARSRFNSGLGGADDVLTAQTAKGDAVIALVQARTTEDAAKVSLLQTLGLNPQTPFNVNDENAEGISMENFDALIAAALAKRPEVLRAKAAIEAAKFGARAAKTTSAPTISSSVTINSSDPGFPNGGGAYGVGVFLSVPLYDGELQAGTVQQAKATLKSAEADLITAQLQVRTDISQAFLATRGAEQQLQAAQTNLLNAKESLRIAEGRYRSGVGLFLDIINAQAALLTAETSVQTANAEVSSQRATLKRAMGNILQY